MIRFKENFNLKPLNTFHIDATCDFFFEFTESAELLVFLENNQLQDKYFILGGGSNVLFVNHFKGLVLHPNIPGIYEHEEDRNYAYVEVGAGVEWDEFVDYAVKYQLGGVENLSLIPGKTGASPVQNIGAYGVEAKDVIYKVKGIDLVTGERVEYTNNDCKFGYRNSIFKNELKGRIVITSVIFRLFKFPEFNLEYGKVKAEVEKLGEVNLYNVRQAVINIRSSKLPDPFEIGNGGSFFKNPMVNLEVVTSVLKDFPDAPVYDTDDPEIKKLAAGWLIDQCGWKGYKKGDVGVHPFQALVLCNFGSACGSDVLELSEDIRESVLKKFGVELHLEVNVVH